MSIACILLLAYELCVWQVGVDESHFAYFVAIHLFSKHLLALFIYYLILYDSRCWVRSYKENIKRLPS